MDPIPQSQKALQITSQSKSPALCSFVSTLYWMNNRCSITYSSPCETLKKRLCYTRIWPPLQNRRHGGIRGHGLCSCRMLLLPLLFQQGGWQSQGHHGVFIQGFSLFPGLLSGCCACLSYTFPFDACSLCTEHYKNIDLEPNRFGFRIHWERTKKNTLNKAASPQPPLLCNYFIWYRLIDDMTKTGKF